MNYNQYYGAQANYMPMQGNQQQYQVPMNTRSQTPAYNQPPQMNQQLPMNPPMNQQPAVNTPANQQLPMNNQMNQQLPMNAHVPSKQALPMTHNLPNQYQYSNNPVMNYASTTMLPNSMSQPQFNSSNQNQVPVTENYQMIPQTQSPYYPMHQTQSSAANSFSGNPPAQSQYAGFTPQGNYGTAQPYGTTNNPQGHYVNAQETPQVAAQNQPSYGGEPFNPQIGQPLTEQVKETKKEKQEKTTHQRTNVVGQYKCSDFPTLFTGDIRRAPPPIQRKPFTLRGEAARPSSQPNPNSPEYFRSGKRWELRGGKYYGCFTSRTNGLQDACPKARCKLCPDAKKK